MYELSRVNGIPCFRALAFKDVPFISHAFFTRQGGISEAPYESLNVSFELGDDLTRVMENRRRVAETLGLRTDNFFFLHQVHGHRVVEARRISHPSPHADAVITDKRGIALAIKTADCVPILLCDPERPAVAAIHSGWRGTAKNIIKGTISMMESKYRTKREKIIAAVGPAIGPCCYEVDRTVAAALLDEKELGPSEKDGKFFIDLTSLNIRQLKAEGLEEKNITAINLCTFCHKKFFFSHRRDHGLTGRQISVIMIL